MFILTLTCGLPSSNWVSQKRHCNLKMTGNDFPDNESVPLEGSKALPAVIAVLDSIGLRKRQVRSILKRAGYRTLALRDPDPNLLPDGTVTLVHASSASGLDALIGSFAARRHPIVVYSEDPTPMDIVNSVFRGAVGYLKWPFDAAEANAAIGFVQVHGTAKVTLLSERLRARAIVATLTARERDVLQLIARGLTNIEMGRELQISVKTVDNHRANVLAKTGGTTASAVYVAAHGLG